jgi:excisionase family DNA binding protein
VSEVEPQPERPVAPIRIGYRVNEWAAQTGTSRETTYRRIKDGTLRSVKYAGVTLVLGFADRAAE